MGSYISKDAEWLHQNSQCWRLNIRFSFYWSSVRNCFLFLRKCYWFLGFSSPASWYLIKLDLRAGEMVQSVQCWLCKFGSPGIRKTERSHSLLSSHINEFQVQWEALSARTRWRLKKTVSLYCKHHTLTPPESVFQIHISSLPPTHPPPPLSTRYV